MKGKNKGITLIALVITIIVLLILSAVVLNMIMGESGIFGKANKAKEDTNLSQAREAVQIALLSARTEYVTDENMDLEAFAEEENSKIDAEVKETNTGREVLGEWEFEYGDYVFGINNLQIESEGKTNKKFKVTASQTGNYVFESESDATTEISFSIELKDNSLSGSAVTIESLTTSLGTVTIDNENLKATIAKNGSNELNGTYQFKVTISKYESTINVNINKFLKDPKVEVIEDTLAWNKFKLKVKQTNDEEYPRDVTYKYTVTGTNVSINNQESNNSEYEVTGTEAKTNYNVTAYAVLGNKTKTAQTTVTTARREVDLSNYNLNVSSGLVSYWPLTSNLNDVAGENNFVGFGDYSFSNNSIFLNGGYLLTSKNVYFTGPQTTVLKYKRTADWTDWATIFGRCWEFRYSRGRMALVYDANDRTVCSIAAREYDEHIHREVTDIPKDEWVTIAIVTDETGTYFYVDGSEVHNQYLFNYGWNMLLGLGCAAGTGEDAVNKNVGDLNVPSYYKDFAIYDRALSAQEIQNIYKN